MSHCLSSTEEWTSSGRFLIRLLTPRISLFTSLTGGKFLSTSVKEPLGPRFEHKVVNEGGKFDFMKMFRGSIAMYNSSRVVITDRLHASIFAFLLHKPHVYLDQSYGKIRRTREVAFNTSSYCQDRQRLRYDQAKNIQQAVDMAAKMLSTRNRNRLFISWKTILF